MDSLLLMKEHIVLQTNKTSILPKDYLFFKAYVLSGPYQYRSSSSKVLKVELLDETGKLVKSQYHKIVGGASEGSIEIPKKTEEGDYYLRTYTRWMLNYGPELFAVKKIRIGSYKKSKESYQVDVNSVRFFPEGGQLISGLTHRVLVKMDDIQATDLPIVDSKKKKVALLKNYGNGIGSFLLNPQKNKRYFLLFNEVEKIALPDIYESGYSIQSNNLDTQDLLVRIEVVPELKNEIIYLKGRSNGTTYFEKKIDFKNKNVIEINVPKNKMPKGIINLQLEDEFDQIWAERPVYIDADELQVKLESISSEDEKSILNIKVIDIEGNPVQTEVSVSLTGETSVGDIKNTSESSVHVGMSLRNQRFLNDLLLLTGQSSKNNEKQPFVGLPSEIRYRFQHGLDFYGQAYDLNKSLLTNTSIQIMILSKDEVIIEEAKTNAKGLFKLSGLSLDGEVQMVFRTAGDESKTKLVQVIPYEFETPPLVKINKEKENDEEQSSAENLMQITNRKRRVDFTLGKNESEELVVLDGVTLMQKNEFKKITPSVYKLEPSKVVYQDTENPRTIPQLFLGIPGVQITGLGDLNPEVGLLQSTGVGPFLWVLDGLPLLQPTSLVQIINLVNYTDIERIEILTSPQASIYGSRAAGGAIVIYTRNGAGNNYVARKEAQLSFKGYHESMDFGEYQKSIPKKIKNADDVQRTLYWNPIVKTDEKGEAKIQFAKPENVDSIFFEAQVITPDGKRGMVKSIWSL
ncbi:TonB-dependent receptor plug domain-containing protein [Muricauda sp. JGD-17]|uniref:TonB-dependent receptor plug domain-containing protein n=1 Tax=Flagellimonas ochracea TaxID=2696472 RepID=A0A964TE49_9FLAO|nr:Plug domain-containing protein [Allomuricauda ochracea]NAY93253.1 TonB-dependent receptor plug domain-containing protein [Allomuricauda ochracea]